MSDARVRVRLDLAYHGGAFVGWARQRSLRSVQGELERVLSLVVGQAVDVTAAGRTDSGVHARGQVCHVDLPAGSELSVDRVNKALPEDIRVLALAEVSEDFNARFSALWRRYSYTVSDDPCGADPLLRHQQLRVTQTLDLDAMNLAAKALLGEHDFTSFCKVKEHGTSIRAVIDVHWDRQSDPMTGLDVAVMQVRADAFCHSMVRSFAGALIPVGQGKKPVDHPKLALEMKSRDAGIPVYPAHPLVLEEVRYPPKDLWALRQSQTRVSRAIG